MFNLFLLFSIAFNTLGLSGAALKVDSGLISRSAGDASVASADTLKIDLPDILAYPTVEKNAAKPKIYAQNFILVDSDSGAILASQKPFERVPVASTTKIMTALVVIENYSLDDVATVRQDAVTTVSNSGAIPDFYTGEKMTVRNLLWCMLMNSSNVAAYTLAEHMNSKNETGPQKFLTLMNQRARDLGLKDSDFRDPAGLDGKGYSTAFDLTVATKEALKSSLFAQIVKTKQSTVYDTSGRYVHQLNNSNRLVNDWDYPGAIGVKTGYMPDTAEQPGAGHTLVAAVERDGHTLISVILKTQADTPSASAEESRRLQDWGWTNVSWE